MVSSSYFVCGLLAFSIFSCCMLVSNCSVLFFAVKTTALYSDLYLLSVIYLVSAMDPSAVEHSANHFGVKLRKVATENSSSNEKINSVGRKSAPLGAPTNCESRANQRRSNPASNHQVALRQEIAEKQAIERRQQKANSRSWDKRAKPLLPPKPVLKASSSLGNITKCANSGLVNRKPLVVQRKPTPVSPTTKKVCTSVGESITPTSADESASSWLSPIYESYAQYKPAFDALYARLVEAVNKQGQFEANKVRLLD